MSRRYMWLYLTVSFLALGALLALRDTGQAHTVWTAGLIVTGLPLVLRTLRGALHRQFATDIVASLSIIGAVALDQPLAGLVIVLMQTGGEALERFAAGRASAALRALEEAAPRIAHVEREGGARVDDVAATDVVVGDVLIVLPGELLPCDGVVIDGESELDASSLTGEPIPIRASAGAHVASGMINALGSFRYRASAIAEQSQYAKIVEQVRAAQASRAPLQRLADRYAVWFTPITLAVCAVAVLVTRDWMRALAILVVATPCPLILATPVALIGGINRAARRFVIVRSGAAIEKLAVVNTIVFDKTGTLTIGKPRLQRVSTAPGFDRTDVLSAAAAAEQRSSHLLASVLVDAVRAQGLPIPPGTDYHESAGQGISSVVNGRRVRVGGRGFIVPRTLDGELVSERLEHPDATLRAYVAIDDRLAAVLEYADELRPEIGDLIAELEKDGVTRFVLLSGDHTPIARDIAGRVGIHEAYGDFMPTDKARFVERLRAEGRVVMMVGDGINDAPALAGADVGVALASYGAGIAAESADVVILVDSVARVRDAVHIARRTMRIARQSIWVGLALSGVAMIVAAFGALAPIVGAGIQEAIDVAVILNALRTAGDGSPRRPGDRDPAAARRRAERPSPREYVEPSPAPRDVDVSSFRA